MNFRKGELIVHNRRVLSASPFALFISFAIAIEIECGSLTAQIVEKYRVVIQKSTSGKKGEKN